MRKKVRRKDVGALDEGGIDLLLWGRSWGSIYLTYIKSDN